MRANCTHTTSHMDLEKLQWQLIFVQKLQLQNERKQRSTAEWKKSPPSEWPSTAQTHVWRTIWCMRKQENNWATGGNQSNWDEQQYRTSGFFFSMKLVLSHNSKIFFSTRVRVFVTVTRMPWRRFSVRFQWRRHFNAWRTCQPFPSRAEIKRSWISDPRGESNGWWLDSRLREQLEFRWEIMAREYTSRFCNTKQEEERNSTDTLSSLWRLRKFKWTENTSTPRSRLSQSWQRLAKPAATGSE